MTAPQQVDAGHLSFLEIIRVLAHIAGPAFASGALLKTGVGVARTKETLEFADLDAFFLAGQSLGHPIARFEGNVTHYGNGVCGLPRCPFAGSIATYKEFAGDLPQEYTAVSEQLNKSTPTTENLRVGHGAAVSPFCGVHQPIRSALAKNVRIGGKELVVYQLGCKSGSGAKGLSHRWIEETKVDPALVEKVLDDNMCCYLVRIEA